MFFLFEILILCLDRDQYTAEKLLYFSHLIDRIRNSKALGDVLQKHSDSDLLEIFCKFGCHLFNIDDGELQPIGVGLFLLPSFFNHSCIGNAVVSFVGQRLFIRVIEPVSIGEEIFISYEDLTRGTIMRRQSLKNTYFFDCNCTECLKFLQSDPEGKDRAHTSASSISEDTTRTVVSQLQSIRDLVFNYPGKSTLKDNSFPSAREALEQTYRKLKDILDPMHWLMTEARTLLIDILIMTREFEEACMLQVEHTKMLDTLLPPNHPLLIVEFTRLGRLYLHQEQESEAFHVLIRAQEKARVCFPVMHRLNRWLDNQLSLS